MSCQARKSRYRAFFSFDAGLAAVLAVFSFASFSLLLSAAAYSADAVSREASSSLLALRLSSFLLDEAGAEKYGWGSGAYVKAGELDLSRLQQMDLGSLLMQTGKSYVKIRVEQGGSEAFFAESGEKQAQVYCATRLGLLGGEIAKLEACVS